MCDKPYLTSIATVLSPLQYKNTETSGQPPRLTSLDQLGGLLRLAYGLVRQHHNRSQQHTHTDADQDNRTETDRLRVAKYELDRHRTTVPVKEEHGEQEQGNYGEKYYFFFAYVPWEASPF